MKAQIQLPKLKIWFETYALRFSSDDPTVQESMDLKTEHTRRVCKAIVDIGRSLDLSEEDLCIAESTALLHDIGRFEQYKRYGTFSDYRSEDHAALGVKVIQADRVLHEFEPDTAGIIIRVVGYHNRATLPAGEGKRCLLFLKLLRDADKVDIWRVVTDYYKNAEHSRNRTIELDLPDENRISNPIYKALINGKLAQMEDLKTLNDFKLLQIGWVYDINFPRTFEIIREKGYLSMIRDTLPRKSARTTTIYKQALSYLERHTSKT